MKFNLLKKSTINFVAYKYHGNCHSKPAERHVLHPGTIPLQEKRAASFYGILLISKSIVREIKSHK